MRFDKLKFKVNKTTFAIMMISVLINCVLGFISQKAGMPLWLNSIGTMITAIHFGPLAGGIVGILTALVFGIFKYNYISYGLAWAATGVAVGYLYLKDHKNDPYLLVAVSVLAGIITAAISTALNLVFFDGYTNNLWGDALFDMLSVENSILIVNAFLAQAFIDLPDKVLAMLVAVYTADKLKLRFDKILAPVAVFACALTFTGVLTAEAVDFYGDYETVTYDSSDGLSTIEINAIAQSEDGFIWAGTYSGLYRYDGNSFELFTIDNRIKNVMQLYSDSQGRLWIGTNDSGVCCFDYKNGSVKFYAMSDGLAADAIRAISEDAEGNIYIGTVGYTSVINKKGEIKTHSDWEEIFYVQSFAELDDGTMIGVTNGGILFALKDDEILWKKEFEGEEGASYTTVCKVDGDMLFAGTGTNMVEKLSVTKDGAESQGLINIGESKYVNRLVHTDGIGGVLVCCENGLGYIEDGTETMIPLDKEGFDGSLSDALVDEQLNIWFASNKQGIIRYSWNPFENIYRKAGIDGSVVNSAKIKDNRLYVGSDSGLLILDMNTYTTVDEPYLAQFENTRVRQVQTDSAGNIWVSTYGQDGLVRIDPEGNTTNFNDRENGALGERFRFVKELSDGSLVAASTSGLTFIENGAVVATIGEANGLKTTTILDVVEAEDGTLRAASDGDGIYIIKNRMVVDRIATDDGLGTLVVMKIVPCEGGYLYITSNALYYDNGKKIKRLNNFPYSNNYDIYISDNKECFITSSAGLYIVKESDLLKDGDYTVTLLNRSRGFSTTFTANAWYELEDEYLYLCCTDGIRKVSTKNYDSFDNDYQIGIASVVAGGEVVHPTNGKYVIPAVSGRIQIRVALMNYSLSNPLVHIYLEGVDDEGLTAYQNELSELGYTNLPYGDYKLHVQIVSESTGKVVRDEVFNIKKKALMYERFYFKVYLFLIGTLFGMFLIWSVVYLRKNAARVRGLQKEVSIDPMTGLFNKSASIKRLTELCRTKKGVLLMIDLDSFKLVNDIYGHDMGDRILIRFAELIRAAIGIDDMAGRMGGDEFIAYLEGDIEEKKVEDVTAYLNAEIVKSAKEYMGEDMEIPLGTSIGAVKCPDEGDDFNELFRLADNALYLVKQNGKHGCDFYHKNRVIDETDTIKDNSTIDSLMKIMGERNVHAGAFVLKPDEMLPIYRFLCRYTNRYPANIEFARIRIFPKNEGEQVREDVVEMIGEMLRTSMRTCDILSRNGTQYVLLYTVAKHADREVLIKRMLSEWEESPESEKYRITYEIQLINKEVK